MDYAKKIVYQSNYWYNDGLKKAQIRDMSGAAKSLKISLQFNRENIAARNLLGLVYYGIGEVAEALVEWIISKNLRPRDNIANYYIKEVQTSVNELETINQAVKKYNQCLGYCRQNGEDLAIIQLKQVIVSHPSFLKAHQLLALLYLHTDQYSRARQVLRAARRIDTANATTLRYMHELTVKRGRGRRAAKKKRDDVVEYSLGNETIIQPKHSAIRAVASRFAVSNIFIGAVIGAAIIWFLVAPAVNQYRSERMNGQMREYSEQIDALQAQISAQTRTLDNYRAESESAEADAKKAASTIDSYENLMRVSDQYRSGAYESNTLADSLMNISRDSLGDNGKAQYDDLTEAIYPVACANRLAEGENAIYAENYEDAVEALLEVVKMDSDYNDGEALLRLGEAYMGSGDNENAAKYFQRVIDECGDSWYAQEAEENLKEVSGASGSSSDNT